MDRTGRLPTDLGLKDTVLVWSGETVKVVVQFGSFDEKQLFPFHCHDLEHEDQGIDKHCSISGVEAQESRA